MIFKTTAGAHLEVLPRSKTVKFYWSAPDDSWMECFELTAEDTHKLIGELAAAVMEAET